MHRDSLAVVLCLSCLCTGSVPGARGLEQPPSPPETVDPEDGPEDREARPIGPFFVGYENEPAMDAGGRLTAAIQSSAGGLLNRELSEPAVAAAWEVPLALLVSVAQHEVFGHGGRAREHDLGPSYGAGFDFTFYTTIDRDPESNLVNSLLAAGGVEATGIQARRILLDAMSLRGTEGSLVPLMLFSKLDLTLYVSQTEEPEAPTDGEDPFRDSFVEGNDMAIYLVSRQGARVGADPSAIWNRDYRIDYSDPLLDETFDGLREAALWNLLDPAVVMTAIGYFGQHLARGEHRVRTPGLDLGRSMRLLAGTRSRLGPGEISRFLDLYLATPWGVVDLYIRDLDSGMETTEGLGLGLHRIPLGPDLLVSLQGDVWDEPEAGERTEARSGAWHGSIELDWMVADRWGLSAKAGSKSEGFFPGAPLEEGTYGAFGILVQLR